MSMKYPAGVDAQGSRQEACVVDDVVGRESLEEINEEAEMEHLPETSESIEEFILEFRCWHHKIHGDQGRQSNLTVSDTADKNGGIIATAEGKSLAARRQRNWWEIKNPEAGSLLHRHGLTSARAPKDAARPTHTAGARGLEERTGVRGEEEAREERERGEEGGGAVQLALAAAIPTYPRFRALKRPPLSALHCSLSLLYPHLAPSAPPHHTERAESHMSTARGALPASTSTLHPARRRAPASPRPRQRAAAPAATTGQRERLDPQEAAAVCAGTHGHGEKRDKREGRDGGAVGKERDTNGGKGGKKEKERMKGRKKERKEANEGGKEYRKGNEGNDSAWVCVVKAELQTTYESPVLAYPALRDRSPSLPLRCGCGCTVYVAAVRPGRAEDGQGGTRSISGRTQEPKRRGEEPACADPSGWHWGVRAGGVVHVLAGGVVTWKCFLRVQSAREAKGKQNTPACTTDWNDARPLQEPPSDRHDPTPFQPRRREHRELFQECVLLARREAPLSPGSDRKLDLNPLGMYSKWKSNVRVEHLPASACRREAGWRKRLIFGADFGSFGTSESIPNPLSVA
ncbi:hypothetical protein DFH09DRAFT_1440348 [Mycena vulgaris]|nr:hypothetical protein DFH09DRAFT_1440348 [Mycena vulgaris]